MATLLLLVLGVTLGLMAYAYWLNRIFCTTPKEVEGYMIDPLSEDEARKTYARIEREGIPWREKLPPRRERRYVVFGGSGLVGGQIVIALLANGTPPEAIRIVDTKGPMREEIFGDASHPASKVQVIHADITTEAGADIGFTTPWAPSVAQLPITVYHTVGVIRPQERAAIFYERVEKVNVTGTAHVIAASKKAGVGVLVFTSSSSVENRDVSWFPPPWRHQPENYVQFIDGSDSVGPMAGQGSFMTCYCRSKAVAERLVCGADEGKKQDNPNGQGQGQGQDGNGKGGIGGEVMRTGAIRPGNAIYGLRNDLVIGSLLTYNTVPSFNAAMAQNFASAINVSLAHLCLESALLGPHADRVSGRAYVVTDAGKAPRFVDTYTVLRSNCIRGFTALRPPPLLFLSIMYVIEAWALAAVYIPLVGRVIGEPQPPLGYLQPGVATSGVNLMVDDGEARKTPAEGGIGYDPACTTVEGMCWLVKEWNEHAIAQEMEAVKKEAQK